MPDIRIEIDEVVLHGVEVADVDIFRRDLVAALTDLASAFDGHHPGGSAAVLDGAPVDANAGQVGPGGGQPGAGGLSTRSASLGAQVARSVWRSMVPPGIPVARTGVR